MTSMWDANGNRHYPKPDEESLRLFLSLTSHAKDITEVSVLEKRLSLVVSEEFGVFRKNI